ncbi:unnamed protein product [Calypogeia fissa]
MGQGYSYKNASTPEPTLVLPDPHGACHFVCRRNSPSSKNYNVHKDSIDGPLWLFVKKTGHTLQRKEPSTLILENFKKEVLCVARLEQRSDDHFNPTYSFKNLERHKVEGQVQMGQTKHETISTIGRDKLEWTCQTKALVFRSHSLTEYLAEVFVKALGSVTRETQKIKGRDSENFPSIRTVYKETKQVDSLHYSIHLAGGDDIYFTLEDPNSQAPLWVCPMFSASVIPSETWQRTWDIQVNEGYDSLLSLLIALVCSSVLSPEKITSYLSVKWP